MLHCTVFFSDPTILGKVSQVINKVHSEIKIEKILDESQFKHLNSETHVLICDEESFTKLSLSIDEHQKFKKIIFIGETIEQYENTLTIAFKKIIIQLCSYLNETIEEMYKKEKYIPVPIYKFKLETNYPFDVFVSLSSEKYVKILHKDHEFQAQRLQKLTFNKVKYLYVKSEQYSEVKACLYTPPTKNSTVELVATELNAVEAVQQYMAEIG
ncbi:MAG: hypothetical protein HON90_14945, partial [Halobacteriovoraceae bacterium]|nr:hypothetical protein [Halobacteriovoraceae bacterium]